MCNTSKSLHLSNLRHRNAGETAAGFAPYFANTGAIAPHLTKWGQINTINEWQTLHFSLP